MKALVLTLTILAAATSFAAGKAEWSCHSSQVGGPMTGHVLEVTSEGNGKYAGVFFPICPVCRVVPTIIHFDSRQLHANHAIYRASNATLDVLVASRVPTRTFSARFTTKFNDVVQTKTMSCTLADGSDL